MAVDNLREFGVMWILAGLLFVSLLYFAIGFTDENNPDALGTTESKFEDFRGEFQSSLVNTKSEGNALLNISAESDPEVSQLGSRDSVATSYGIAGNSGGFFDKTSRFFEWIIPGANGTLIIATLGGIFAFLLVYFITKWVRNGI